MEDSLAVNDPTPPSFSESMPCKGDAGPSGMTHLIRAGSRDPVSMFRKIQVVRATYRDWPLYWATRVSGAPPVRIYHLRGGPRMWLRTRTVDFYIVDEVYRQRVYFPAAGWIEHDGITVDVGAHIGAFTLLASRMAPGGRVVAVEPHPGNFDLLRRNLLLNECTNVEPLPYALGSRKEVRDLHLSAFNVGGHSFFLRSQQAVKVDTTTLEDLVARLHLPRIDLLKLDCEGAEHEILRGLPGDLLHRIRRVSLECHDLGPGRDGSSLERFLTDAGFEVWTAPGKQVIHARRS